MSNDGSNIKIIDRSHEDKAVNKCKVRLIKTTKNIYKKLKANKHLLYCYSSHLHLEKVENLNCLYHPELTDNDYILEKAKSLGM